MKKVRRYSVAVLLLTAWLYGPTGGNTLLADSNTAGKKTRCSKKNNPPGTVHLENNLFIDETEICNIHYKEFLFDLKYQLGEESEEYLAASALPADTTLVFYLAEKKETLSLDTYRNHPAYFYYPVVGISYEQAVSYCKWRTKKVNETLYFQSKNPDWNIAKSDIPQTVTYRLPSKEEWLKAANTGMNPKHRNKLTNKGVTHQMINGTLIAGNFNIHSKSIPDFVFGIPEDQTGCRHLYGNVSEMILTKGKCMGGNYQTPISDLKTNQTYDCNASNLTVGFRCVAEMIKLEQ